MVRENQAATNNHKLIKGGHTSEVMEIDSPYHEWLSNQVHMLQENQSLPCLVDHEDEQMEPLVATRSPFLYWHKDCQVYGCDSHIPSDYRTST